MPQAGGLPLAPAQPPRTKVALLLPLTGGNAQLGQQMLNAAQLALFEQGAPGFEFVPRDTGGTAAGAAEAARGAIAGGARVLVGPLTTGETAAAAPARAASVPMLPFTNDSNQAAPLVWPLGITPGQQMRRLVAGAHAQGAQRFALAAPSGAFGQQLAAGLRSAASDLGLPAPVILNYPGAAQPALAAKDIATRLAPPAEGTPPPPVDMLILAEGGTRAREFAAALAGAGLTPMPKLAGSLLWASEAGLAQEPALAGAWYPAGDPAARAQFDSRYASAFGERPSRVAGVAYDAAALAARAVRGQPDAVPQMPVGELVLGADGALRLGPNGQVQRALAVFQVAPGEGQVVQPADMPGSVGY